MADSITKTLTVTNDVYTIGDVVGGLITFDVIGGAMHSSQFGQTGWRFCNRIRSMVPVCRPCYSR